MLELCAERLCGALGTSYCPENGLTARRGLRVRRSNPKVLRVMNIEQGFRRRARAPSDLQLLRSERGKLAELLLVLESHLALMITGERFDGAVMLDAVDYLIDHVSGFPRSREDRVVAASGAELYHRLDLAIRDESVNRREVVRLGFAYCIALRRRMSIEETTHA